MLLHLDGKFKENETMKFVLSWEPFDISANRERQNADVGIGGIHQYYSNQGKIYNLTAEEITKLYMSSKPGNEYLFTNLEFNGRTWKKARLGTSHALSYTQQSFAPQVKNAIVQFRKMAMMSLLKMTGVNLKDLQGSNMKSNMPMLDIVDFFVEGFSSVSKCGEILRIALLSNGTIAGAIIDAATLQPKTEIVYKKFGKGVIAELAREVINKAGLIVKKSDVDDRNKFRESLREISIQYGVRWKHIQPNMKITPEEAYECTVNNNDKVWVIMYSDKGLRYVKIIPITTSDGRKASGGLVTVPISSLPKSMKVNFKNVITGL